MHILRDNYGPIKSPFWKIVTNGKMLVTASGALMMCVSGIRDKVGNILDNTSVGLEQISQTIKTPPYRDVKESAGMIKTEEKVSKQYTHISHTIKKGDTLGGISRRYNISLTSILEANPHISSADMIHVGGIITIPIVQTPQEPQNNIQKTPRQQDTSQPDGSYTRIFEGYSPTMQKDKVNNTTFFIGYGTDVGTLTDSYPYATYGSDVANYFSKKGFTKKEILAMMHGEKAINHSIAEDLFLMRYIPRYQKIKTLCGKKWSSYPKNIQAMLVDLSYNLKGEYGIFPTRGFPGFPDAVKALNAGDYKKFSNEIATSNYADQVGSRRAGMWLKEIEKRQLGNNSRGLVRDTKTLISGFTKHHEKEIRRARTQKL